MYTGVFMDSIKFVLREDFDIAREKNKFEVLPQADEVIKQAQTKDILGLVVVTDSPTVVKEATIMTKERFLEGLKTIKKVE